MDTAFSSKGYLKKAERLPGSSTGARWLGQIFMCSTAVIQHHNLARGWVTSISAGVGDEGMHRSSFAYIFGMSIHLTDFGLEKIFEIIGFVYQYLKLLRHNSPQEWIFKEP
ncbi:hypothetical protein HAX54_006675 [Datura stramonium]|uniref:Uncharacterized protein n=1 Tax=Datura stramonium TaxID=4076 RepID=A0ABS8TD79_DATST|nr:hypothetical protein [Datura stramonium]